MTTKKKPVSLITDFIRLMDRKSVYTDYTIDFVIQKITQRLHSDYILTHYTYVNVLLNTQTFRRLHNDYIIRKRLTDYLRDFIRL